MTKGQDPLVEDSACLYLQESNEVRKQQQCGRRYSAIKNQLLIHHNIDANKWGKTVAFLKRAGEEETKKRQKFSRELKSTPYLTSQSRLVL